MKGCSDEEQGGIVIVLGIESASIQGGVALVGAEGVIAEYVLNVEATYAERLMPAVDQVLRDARITIPEVEGLAISIGPGSFTGLRIGLSTVKGLALATGKPVVGVPTLHALAWSIPYCRYPVCAILGARKKEVYCALFEYRGAELVCLMEDAALTPEAVVEQINQPTLFVGDGWRVHGAYLQEALGGLAIPPPTSRGACPAAVADLGRRRLLRGEKDSVEELVPRYIRPTEAELKRRKRN
ncbi:MAG: tRNA (adenosine(37)-N6)-threonylcarbamoyltransferase complex dimerization subunit type 1 TsaB [candidate division NC10 bacterium]|nr:tRNA (adenosine(37)-N6)-threonylcarbamoyltransferase complex dimerization subunit type 1 TsaB [candidate division NC10 bacterium]